jgi:hypothetical protein
MRTIPIVLTSAVLALAWAAPSHAGAHRPGLHLESELDLGGVPYRFRLGVGRENGVTLRGEVDAGSKRYRLRLDLDADVIDRPEPAPNSRTLERL